MNSTSLIDNPEDIVADPSSNISNFDIEEAKAELKENDKFDSDQSDTEAEDSQVGQADEMLQMQSLFGLATEDNKKLEEDVHKKESQLAAQNDTIEQYTDRLKIIKEHMKNVQSELIHTQQLLEARDNESNAELHLKALSEREISRYRSDMREWAKQQEDIKDMIASLQIRIHRSNEQLAQFQDKMHFDSRQLEEWIVASRTKTDDFNALLRYKYQDDARIKSLLAEIETKTKAVSETKRLLEEEITETSTAQIELDRTAEEFRRLHQERQSLITQWDAACVRMTQRDKEIARIGEEVMESKEQAAILKSEVSKNADLLKQASESNINFDNLINAANRNAEKLRTELSALMNEENENRHLIDVMKIESKTLENDLINAERSRITHQELIVSKQNRAKQEEEKIESIQKDIQLAKKDTMTVADKAKATEKMLVSKQSELKGVERQFDFLKDTMFKHSQTLYKLHQDELSLKNEISGTQATSRNLQAKVNELNQRSLKQQEMLYNIEFQVQALERKVERAGGKRSQEETKILNEKINYLKTGLERQNMLHSSLTNQYKKLNDDFRASKRNFTQIEEQHNSLDERIAELNLEMTSATRELTQLEKNKEDKSVLHDVLKLKVKRLRDKLAVITEQVFSLKSEQYEWEVAMKAKKHEIDTENEVLRMQAKAARESIHSVQSEYNDRLMKMNALKGKFATIAGKTGKMSKEEGDHIQAKYIIAAAQEREELQRRGDELNEATKQAIKQTKMMQNTLNAVKNCNMDYEVNQKAQDMKSEEAKKKARLQGEVKAEMSAVYREKAGLEEIRSESENLRREIVEIEMAIQMMNTGITIHKRDINELDNTILQQNEKLIRASKQVTKLQNIYRKENKANGENLPEYDIRLQETKSRNNMLLTILQNFSDHNPEIEPILLDLMQESGLQFPQSRPTSSRPSSSRPPSNSKGSRPNSGRPISGQSSSNSRPTSSSKGPSSARAITPKSIDPFLRK